MGITRKMLSVGTAGAIDFRSDKERTARSTRQAAHQARQQTRLMRDMRGDANRDYVVQFQAPVTASAAPPGYYLAADGHTRWWDGSRWY